MVFQIWYPNIIIKRIKWCRIFFMQIPTCLDHQIIIIDYRNSKTSSRFPQNMKFKLQFRSDPALCKLDSHAAINSWKYFILDVQNKDYFFTRVNGFLQKKRLTFLTKEKKNLGFGRFRESRIPIYFEETLHVPRRWVVRIRRDIIKTAYFIWQCGCTAVNHYPKSIAHLLKP